MSGKMIRAVESHKCLECIRATDEESKDETILKDSDTFFSRFIRSISPTRVDEIKQDVIILVNLI